MSNDSIARRRVLAGLAALAVAPLMTEAAVAQAAPKGRIALPGGGSIVMPSPYKVETKYPNYAKPEWDVRVGYRNWRSTMSGHPDCDGVIAVGRTDKFTDVADFVRSCGGLSIAWSDADRNPKGAWGDNETRWPREVFDTPEGPELRQQLAVHRVGFFDVYDEPARLLARAHPSGVSVAVWIYEKHGGDKGARRLIDRIGASCRA